MIQSEMIKKIISLLQERVTLDANSEKPIILFDEPSAEDLMGEGFDREMIDHTVKAGWWSEMVTDILETPDFAEPGESPEQVLKYARDAVYEYVGKRIL